MGDLYRDLFDIVDSLDLHDYSLDHPFYKHLNPEQMVVAMKYREENKKKLGKMKDEVTTTFLSEFVGLRSKVYSMKFADDTETKKCGGTTVRKTMTDFNFNLYRSLVTQAITS